MARRGPWLNNWEVVSEMIGAAGGQGRPFRVRRRGTDDPEGRYVLKILKDQQDPDRRRRMYTEVAALQVVAGDGVCKHVESNADLWESNAALYVVTEYVPGPTLFQAVSAKPPSLSEAVTVTRGILRVLARC